MPNIISNASGAINETVAITQAMVSDQYKLTYTCSNVGDGKSFLLITGDNTYFFPLQFTGQQEVLFNAEFGSLIQCVLHGNASISGLTLSTNDTLSDADRQAIDLVKTDSDYWQRIKAITNDLGKVRADMMQGILNMTLNSFANENGTVKQENGIYTWMNGSSYETATEAVRVSGGAIGVSNQKDGQGDWVWRTAITGAGIKAESIVAGKISGSELDGGTVTGGSITGAKVTGVEISGSKIISGSYESRNYIELDKLGNIHGVKDGVEVFTVDVQYGPVAQIYLKTTDGSSTLLIGESNHFTEKGFTVTAWGGFLDITSQTKVAIDAPEIEINAGGGGGNAKFNCNIIDKYGDTVTGKPN